jgi:hypothetical protein
VTEAQTLSSRQRREDLCLEDAVHETAPSTVRKGDASSFDRAMLAQHSMRYCTTYSTGAATSTAREEARNNAAPNGQHALPIGENSVLERVLDDKRIASEMASTDESPDYLRPVVPRKACSTQGMIGRDIDDIRRPVSHNIINNTSITASSKEREK